MNYWPPWRRAHGRWSRGIAEPTRLHEAQHAATEALAVLAPGADAFILEAAREPRLVGPVSRDEQQLRAAVSSLVVREVEGDLASAVALAADRLRALGGKKRLIVLTDGALADPKPLVAGVDVQVITVDEDNAAIVRIDVRAGLDHMGVALLLHDIVQSLGIVRRTSVRHHCGACRGKHQRLNVQRYDGAG
ncbi:MAG: VWA domain-containing protein [Myxococcales bacterium]